MVLSAGDSGFVATPSNFCSLESPGRHHVVCKPATCSCCKGECYAGLCERKCCQRDKGGDLTPLLSTGDATHVVQGPVQGSSVYKTPGHTEETPAKGCWDGWETGEPLLRGKAVRAGTLQPGEGSQGT